MKKNRYDYNGFGDQYERSRYEPEQMQIYLKNRSESLMDMIHAYALNHKKKIRILEIGCGTGLTLSYLSRNLSVDSSLIGMDLSMTMLKQTVEKKSCFKQPPSVLLANSLDLPFNDNSFDIVYATRFIHQFSNSKKKHIKNEIMRITKKEGLIILEFYAHFFHLLRYYFGTSGRKRKGRKGFLEHYPKNKEVQEIIGEPFKIKPLRVAGSRLLVNIFGVKILEFITYFSTSYPFKVLLDEYFVIVRK